MWVVLTSQDLSVDGALPRVARNHRQPAKCPQEVTQQNTIMAKQSFALLIQCTLSVDQTGVLGTTTSSSRLRIANPMKGPWWGQELYDAPPASNFFCIQWILVLSSNTNLTSMSSIWLVDALNSQRRTSKQEHGVSLWNSVVMAKKNATVFDRHHQVGASHPT